MSTNFNQDECMAMLQMLDIAVKAKGMAIANDNGSSFAEIGAVLGKKVNIRLAEINDQEKEIKKATAPEIEEVEKG